MLATHLPTKIIADDCGGDQLLEAEGHVIEVHPTGVVVMLRGEVLRGIRLLLASIEKVTLDAKELPVMELSLTGVAEDEMKPDGRASQSDGDSEMPLRPTRMMLFLNGHIDAAVRERWESKARWVPSESAAVPGSDPDAGSGVVAGPPAGGGPSFARSPSMVERLASLKSRFLRRPGADAQRAAEDATAGRATPVPAAEPKGADRRSSHRVSCRIECDFQFAVGAPMLDTRRLPGEICDVSWLGVRLMFAVSARDEIIHELREAKIGTMQLTRSGRGWIFFESDEGRYGLTGRIVWFDTDAKSAMGRRTVAVGVSLEGGDENDPLRAFLVRRANISASDLPAI